MNPDNEHPNLARALRGAPHRWSTEAVELARIMAAVSGDMTLEQWRRWLDELSPASVANPVPEPLAELEELFTRMSEADQNRFVERLPQLRLG